MKTKIAVIGSLNMDITVTTDRIPGKGETVAGGSVHYNPGGKGANQAVAAARLGAEVQMFGCVGQDNYGTDLIAHLNTEGVGTDYIKKLSDAPTGIALITVGEHDNTIVVVAGANGQTDCGYVDEIKDKLSSFDMVVLQHEIPLPTVEYIVSICAAGQIPVVLNPAPAAPVSNEVIGMVSYLTPNEHEAAIIFGSETDTGELLKRYPEKLMITQGEKGVAVALNSGEVLTVPARPADVVDTTGAGDTLNGAFAVFMAEQRPLKEALMLANIAASLSTEGFGAQSGMPAYDLVMTEYNKMTNVEAT